MNKPTKHSYPSLVEVIGSLSQDWGNWPSLSANSEKGNWQSLSAKSEKIKGQSLIALFNVFGYIFNKPHE